MPRSASLFTAFARERLLDAPTPIQHLARLSNSLGVDIHVKRDDLTGLGGGGNKLRKLEFLLGEALAQGADTVITVGALQSNHARLTAAVAARAGLQCELVLTRSAARDDEDYRHNGNVLLDRLFGARVHALPAGADGAAFAAARQVDAAPAPFEFRLARSRESGAIGTGRQRMHARAEQPVEQHVA
ncbi:MAG: pyridoxal-phosphate dependent enzyme, partial [Oxalobacteraceae bacterium]